MSFNIKESSVEIHIPGQDGDFIVYISPCFFVVHNHTYCIIHKSHFNHTTVEYRQPRFGNFKLCFEDNSCYYPGVILSKHGPSKMSRFFHSRSFTVNGLPIHFSTQAYFSLIKQIHVPHTNGVKKKRTAIKT